MEFKGIELDIIITPEGEGKNIVYNANAIQIPNVVTQGKTIEEAKKRLKEALNLYLEDLPEEKYNLSREKESNVPLITRMIL